MNDEKATTGGSTVATENPTDAQSAVKQAPVMDVVPPPAGGGETPVVTAPPEDEYLPVGEDIAKQIEGDPEMPQSGTPATSPAPTVATPEPATAPEEPKAAEDAKDGDSPDELIQEEAKHEEPTPAAVAKPHKPANPARTAVIATVFITIALAGLTVFAYMSTQK